MASDEARGHPDDPIQRGNKNPNPASTATFIGLRLLDPVLQYYILSRNFGSGLITTLRGTTLPHGPALITNTPFDRLGLSPYRSILWSMSAVSMLKQNITIATVSQEAISPGFATAVGLFNATFNSINTLLFICAQTSASVNGEHFPQTPLITGSILFAVGMAVEWGSELQRHFWKKDPANKGQVYEQGLFGLSRHINYFGYTLWRTGFALASSGWTWGAVTAAFFTYNFTTDAIPKLQEYMEKRYGEKFRHYEQAVPYKFVPFVY